MKRFLAYFFLTCSLVLVFGHSILPHSHLEKDYNVYEISEARTLSLSEIIKLALTSDLGINHLEEFRDSDVQAYSYDISENDVIISTDDELKFGVYHFLTKPHLVSDEELLPPCCFTSKLLRAPPHFS